MCSLHSCAGRRRNACDRRASERRTGYDLKLTLTITPQRSTQYSNMTEVLAAPELLASPLGSAIRGVEHVKLAGQGHLLVDIDERALPAVRQGVSSPARAETSSPTLPNTAPAPTR